MDLNENTLLGFYDTHSVSQATPVGVCDGQVTPKQKASANILRTPACERNIITVKKIYVDLQNTHRVDIKVLSSPSQMVLGPLYLANKKSTVRPTSINHWAKVFQPVTLQPI